MVFDGINVANSGALVRVVAKAPMDDTYSDFVVQPQRGCDYETTNVGVHPPQRGFNSYRGYGRERRTEDALELQHRCNRDAREF